MRERETTPERRKRNSLPPVFRHRAGRSEAAQEASSGRTVWGQSQPHQNLPKTTVTARARRRAASVPRRTRWNSLSQRVDPKNRSFPPGMSNRSALSPSTFRKGRARSVAPWARAAIRRLRFHMRHSDLRLRAVLPYGVDVREDLPDPVAAERPVESRHPVGAPFRDRLVHRRVGLPVLQVRRQVRPDVPLERRLVAPGAMLPVDTLPFGNGLRVLLVRVFP